jgi:hypothetical protein
MTTETPAQPPAAEASSPPPVQPAPPTQRSTGGDPGTRGNQEPASLAKANVQALLQKAYARSAQGEREQDATSEPKPAPKAARAVDEAAPEAVQETQTKQDAPSPRPPAPARRTPSPRRASTMPEVRQEEPAAEAPAVASPEAQTPPEAQAAEAPTPPPEPEGLREEDFRTPAWRRAFAAQPGIRREVARIRNAADLSASQKTERLAERLAEGLQTAANQEWQEQQLANLRDQNPPAYAEYVRNREAAQRQDTDLAQRISNMIAEAFSVPADDPGFVDAGPREGETHEQGLQRFVDYMASKSPVLGERVKGAVTKREEALVQAHEKEIATLKAQHAKQMETAVERARARARAPFQANGGTGTVPRATGTGIRPAGAEEGNGRIQVPQRAPDIATVRGLIGQGYQQREQP